MTAVVGRISEKKELDRAMHSSGADLVVVYGRRRVGKTFLIREHLRQAIIFELTGLHNEPLRRQLKISLCNCEHEQAAAMKFRIISSE